MRQVILIDNQDITGLRQGQPLLIQLNNGQSIEIGYDGTNSTRPGGWRWTGGHNATASAPPAAPALPAPKPKPVKAPKPKVKCPYCTDVITVLGPHVRQMHPDKGLVASGGTKCRWCPKRYPSSRSAIRHEVMKHLTEYHAMKKGEKA